MSEAARFAAGLLARNIELTICNNRLRVWPWRAFKTLTPAERAFYRSHRAELKSLAWVGLTTLPDHFTTAMKTAALLRLVALVGATPEPAPVARPHVESWHRNLWRELSDD